jgi:glycosyltransferase involved in cell wall biosynthesis
MNILIQSHSSGDTGSDFSLRELVHYLSSNGNNVYLCLPVSCDKEFVKSLAISNENIIYLKPTIWHKTKTKGFFSTIYMLLYRLYKTKGGVFYTVPKLLFFLLKKKINIVHSNSFVLIDSAIAAKLLKIPHIQHLREMIYGENPNFTFFLQSRPKIFKRMMNFLHAKIVSNSLFVYNNTKSFFPLNKHDVLKNSFSDEMYDLNYKKAQNISTVGLVANVTSDCKNHIAFLEIARVSKELKLNLNFFIYGKLPNKDDKYYQSLINFIDKHNLSDCVEFKGYCDNLIIFKKIDILVHTNDKETFGRIYIEAMIFKTPIISIKSDAANELICNGENGFIIDEINPKLFVDVIKKLMKDYEMYSNIIDNAFKSSLEYKNSSVNKKLNIIYQSIL